MQRVFVCTSGMMLIKIRTKSAYILCKTMHKAISVSRISTRFPYNCRNSCHSSGLKTRTFQRTPIIGDFYKKWSMYRNVRRSSLGKARDNHILTANTCTFHRYRWLLIFPRKNPKCSWEERSEKLQPRVAIDCNYARVDEQRIRENDVMADTQKNDVTANTWRLGVFM